MSIATQTFEHAYSPRKEETQLDRAKPDTQLGRYSTAEVIILPERTDSSVDGNSEKIERVGPEYTFENLLAIREEIAELAERIADLRRELVDSTRRAEITKDQIDDIGMLAKQTRQPDRIEAHVSQVGSRLQTMMADIAIMDSEIKAKENAKSKFLEWQKEIELALEMEGNKQYFALKDAETVHPYSAGSLDRANGTILDRTPRNND